MYSLDLVIYKTHRHEEVKVGTIVENLKGVIEFVMSRELFLGETAESHHRTIGYLTMSDHEGEYIGHELDVYGHDGKIIGNLAIEGSDVAILYQGRLKDINVHKVVYRRLSPRSKIREIEVYGKYFDGTTVWGLFHMNDDCEYETIVDGILGDS